MTYSVISVAVSLPEDYENVIFNIVSTDVLCGWEIETVKECAGSLALNDMNS